MVSKQKSSKSSVVALGASGKKDMFFFDPEKLTIVKDEKSPIFDDRGLTPAQERLVKSIMQFGVIEPVVIHKNAETADIEVVDGRKRTLACREANRRLVAAGQEPKLIPAIVKQGDDDTLFGVMVAANIREPETFMNRAKKMQNYLARGMTEEQTSITFGVSVAVVKSTVAVLGATAVVRQAAEREQISLTEAGRLAKMEPEEQRKKVAKLLAEAPRAKGKVRRSDGARAREILGDGAPIARKKSELGDKLKELEAVGGGDDRAVAALRWALGQLAVLAPVGVDDGAASAPLNGAAPVSAPLRAVSGATG